MTLRFMWPARRLTVGTQPGAIEPAEPQENGIMGKHLFKQVSRFSLAAVIALLVIAPQHALADDDDPPSVVARLGYMSGSISFQPAGTDEWVNAVVNRPITT